MWHEVKVSWTISEFMLEPPRIIVSHGSCTITVSASTGRGDIFYPNDKYVISVRRINEHVLLYKSGWLAHIVLLVQVAKVTEMSFGTRKIYSAKT